MSDQTQAERVYEIRRLYDAGAVDRTAALLRLSVIHDTSASAPLQRLCVRVAETIGGIRLAMPAAPTIVEELMR